MEDGGWKREVHPLILAGDDMRSLKFSGMQLETHHLVSYGRTITLRLSRAWRRLGSAANKREHFSWRLSFESSCEERKEKYFLFWQRSGIDAFKSGSGMTADIGVGIFERFRQSRDGSIGLAAEFAERRRGICADVSFTSL